MNRTTPFELVFRDLVPAFESLRVEAGRRGHALDDLPAFARAPAVQRLLQRLEAPDLLEREPAAAAEYLTLLYAAFRFWDAGERVVAVDRAALEPALAADPGAHSPVVPAGACYLQLPHQWFWGQVAPEQPHEPLDGAFVAAGSRGDALTVVAVLGLRPERQGFSQVSLTAHPDDLRAAAVLARPERFAPAVEGGDRAGFRSVTSAAELLLLVQLALVHGAG